MICAAELEQGWVEFRCAEHGVLLVGSPRCRVRCRCGRVARPSLNGTVLKGRDLDRLQKTVQKSLQMRGSIPGNGGFQRLEGRR